MLEISTTKVHYVRCIKPNAVKAHDKYDMQMVVAQLRCAGVMAAIKVGLFSDDKAVILKFW